MYNRHYVLEALAYIPSGLGPMSTEERNFATPIWVEDEEEVWVQAELLSYNGDGSARIKYSGMKETVDVNLEEVTRKAQGEQQPLVPIFSIGQQPITPKHLIFSKAEPNAARCASRCERISSTMALRICALCSSFTKQQFSRTCSDGILQAARTPTQATYASLSIHTSGFLCTRRYDFHPLIREGEAADNTRNRKCSSSTGQHSPECPTWHHTPTPSQRRLTMR